MSTTHHRPTPGDSQSLTLRIWIPTSACLTATNFPGFEGFLHPDHALAIWGSLLVGAVCAAVVAMVGKKVRWVQRANLPTFLGLAVFTVTTVASSSDPSKIKLGGALLVLYFGELIFRPATEMVRRVVTEAMKNGTRKLEHMMRKAVRREIEADKQARREEAEANDEQAAAEPVVASN